MQLGKAESIHEDGMPGVGAKSVASSVSLSPPSLSLSCSKKRSTKNLYPAGPNSADANAGTSNLGCRKVSFKERLSAYWCFRKMIQMVSCRPFSANILFSSRKPSTSMPWSTSSPVSGDHLWIVRLIFANSSSDRSLSKHFR